MTTDPTWGRGRGGTRAWWQALQLSVSFALGVVLTLTSGCDRPPGKPTAADVPIEPRQVTNFAALYQENCAGCHGVNGQGNAALALANPVYLAIVTDDTLRRVTTAGISGTLMPAFATSAGGFLTDDQIDILVRGIRTHWARPEALAGVTPPPYAATTAGDPGRGAQVFATFCVACHGADGRGTAQSGSIVDGSFLALVSDQNLRTTVIAGRPDRGHPDWRNCLSGQALTGPQVTDVVAWLAAQRVATPGRPYATAKP